VTQLHKPHSGFDAQFRAGLAAGQLQVARCRGCGAVLPFDARRCPAGHDAIDWKPASGKATLVAWTRLAASPASAGPAEPLLAQVQLAEGPQLVAALDLRGREPREGLALRVHHVGERSVSFVPEGAD
jgi:uncharacterized OB-fold protein